MVMNSIRNAEIVARTNQARYAKERVKIELREVGSVLLRVEWLTIWFFEKMLLDFLLNE